MTNAAVQALTRFGLGRKAGEPLPADPRGWLLGQLQGPDPAAFPDLQDSGSILRAVLDQKAEHHKVKKNASQSADAASTAMADTPADAASDDKAHRKHGKPLRIGPHALREDVNAQLAWAIGTDAPFRERLVWFWTNHFTVSAKRGNIAPITGAYVREAIRPHVTGRFEDMLLAVMRHPAMLMYLDNEKSIGPNSAYGENAGKGLNENLGRESLELHTVTPASGYTQADVTTYAKILTGWAVDMKADQPGFEFRERMHEPGEQVLMGRSFPDGEQGGIAALRFLGTHPATYRALATSLARHFIADTPPPDAVARIAARLHATGGNLGDAAAAVVTEPDAWQPLTKLRTPQDYVVAVMRAVGPIENASHKLPVVLNGMGQPQWAAPLPNGWSDKAADWADPETLLRRTDWAYEIAGQAGDRDADQIARESLGTLIKDDTVTAMQHAGSRREALTLLLTSPEFMRR